ncbi:MAG: M23 family metallopeptidase [Blastocatellia bacterium]
MSTNVRVSTRKNKKVNLNFFLVALLLSVFCLQQSSFAQDYKHLAMSSNLANNKSTVNDNKTESADSSEVKEVVTRPRFVNPKRVLNFAKKYYFPLKGLISSIYGEKRRGHRHKGIDIAAATGTPIYPAAEGKVVFSGWQSGYGNTLIIEHKDGQLSRYAHAQRLFVSEGDSVSVNDTIALVGSTGRSTGPHLHFELTDSFGNQLNPLKVLYKRNLLATDEQTETTEESIVSNVEVEEVTE